MDQEQRTKELLIGELHDQDIFLHQVLNSLPHPFYVIDVNDYSISLANTAAGLDPGVKNTTCHKLSHHRDEPCQNKDHPCPMELVKATKKPAIVEHIHLNEKGEDRIVEVSCFPIFNKAGDVIKVIEYGIDITEKRYSEHILLKLNQAIRNSSDVVFMTDPEGIITYVNPEFSRLYGYTSEEVVGLCTPRILNSGLYGKDASKMLWDTLLNKKSIPATQYVNRCKNGKLIDVEGSADPILDEHGDLLGFLGTQRDITQRKRSEKIQRVVFDIANAVNSTFDLNDLHKTIKDLLGELIDTSNYFIAIYNRENSTISLPYMVDENDVFTSIPIDSSLTGFVIRSEKSMLLRRKDYLDLARIENFNLLGTEPLVWMGVPLKYQDEVIGALVVQSYHDENAFTEADMGVLEYVSHQIGIAIQRKNSETDLITLIEKAEESDRLKSAFLANISHEIRTPLNSILGFSELLCDPEEDEEVKKEYVNIINTSGDRLLSIIDDIVNISLIEAGQFTLYPAEFDLCSMVKNLHSHFDAMSRSSEFDVKLGHCPAFLLVSDQKKIKQVITRLLTNASKNTNDGEIELGYEILDESIRFYVRDTGKGIPPGLERKLFERFYRVEDSHHLLPGTGLGLAICRAIVGALGGKIWYESQLGVGNTFYFTIPINILEYPEKRKTEDY